MSYVKSTEHRLVVQNEYAKAGVPMLPVTHGERYTRRHVARHEVGDVDDDNSGSSYSQS